MNLADTQQRSHFGYLLDNRSPEDTGRYRAAKLTQIDYQMFQVDRAAHCKVLSKMIQSDICIEMKLALQ